MDSTVFPTLSERLLNEARKFQGYPRRIYRTARNLKFREEVWDPVFRQIIDWRRTFEPKGATAAGDVWPPVLVDELYCRELLKQVPGMVERTGRLSRVSFAGLPADSFKQLREAAECYIRGLPLASVALSRAAIEVVIRSEATKTFGKAVIEKEDLFTILKNRLPRHLLTEDELRLAHRIRLAGNDVLHRGVPAALAEALEIIEAARKVVLAASRRSA